MSKRTSLLRGNNGRAFLTYLKEIGVPFEMICSNYTTVFKIDGLERKFVNSMQSKRVFACFAKIKSDLKKKAIPVIDYEQLRYFVHDFKKNEHIGDVINVDMKSAYATILYNDGFIRKETYEYICKGPKQERLVAVGMLASKKQHFVFDKGKIISNDEIVSDTANFFYYAVMRTAEIMGQLKKLCKDAYLFTWVDGIYLRPDVKALERIEKYITSIGYPYSTEWLRDFSVRISSKQATVDFLKMVKGEWVKKPFNLPLVNTEFKRLVIEAILINSKSKNNETILDQISKGKSK